MTDGQNALANSPFGKLSTELLIKILERARPDDIFDVYKKKYSIQNDPTQEYQAQEYPTQKYPTLLALVCRSWREVVLGVPTFWSNIYIVENCAKEMKAARINLRHSGTTVPLFLTWFSMAVQFDAEPQQVIDEFVIPYRDRWQRITLHTDEDNLADNLHVAMASIDFRVLQVLEIRCASSKSPPSGPALCHSAPLLRLCRLYYIPSLPPIPSNLVVLDYAQGAPLDLDPLLEFLHHVAHSLEHLRFISPTSNVSVTPREFRVTLQNLKTLLIEDSHDIMEHILAPNLTYFSVRYRIAPAMQKVANMFHGFEAPKLQSIRFSGTPLQPLLRSCHFPSTFPLLKSAVFEGCGDESAIIKFLEPSENQKAENAFPELEELAISNLADPTSLQAAIEKRLKNGGKSLRMIHLPEGDETRSRQLCMPIPPELQDDFFNEDLDLFDVIREWFECEEGDGGDEMMERGEEEMMEGIEEDNEDEEDEDEGAEGDGFYDV